MSGAAHRLVFIVLGLLACPAAAREELTRGLRGLLGRNVPVARAETRQGIVLAGTPSTSPRVAALGLRAELARAGDEGYVIRSVTSGGSKDPLPRTTGGPKGPQPRTTGGSKDPLPRTTVIAANTDIGVLYGAFAFLRLLQTQQPIDA